MPNQIRVLLLRRHLNHLGRPAFVSCLSTEMPNLCTTTHTLGKPTMTPALNSVRKKGWGKKGRVCYQRGGRGTCCFGGIAKKVQSLISRLIVKIKLPAQPIPGLNLHLLQSARLTGGLPVTAAGVNTSSQVFSHPHPSQVDPNQAATVRLHSPLQLSFTGHKPF